VSHAFLRWAHQQPGPCAIHRYVLGETVPAIELHHFGDKGVAQKGSPYLIARVCLDCHAQYQGKRRIAFLREGQLAVLEAMEADALALLTRYVEEGGQAPERCQACAHWVGGLCNARYAHVEPPSECARDEGVAWALAHVPEDPEGALAWMEIWAGRRHAGLLTGALAHLREVEEMLARIQRREEDNVRGHAKDAAFVLSRAIAALAPRAAVQGDINGSDGPDQ
jgi:hypothetical protein